MKITTKKLILASTIASFFANAATDDEVQPTDQINFAYSGDQTRLGVGIDEEGEVIGEFLKSFNSTIYSSGNSIGEIISRPITAFSASLTEKNPSTPPEDLAT